MARQAKLNLLKGQRGGPGRGQGRTKRKFDYVPHVRRPFLEERHPVHVTTKVLKGLPSLRGRRLWAAVRRGFVRGCKKNAFRIVHYSVQGTHIHLVCEARDRQALSRGIQGFKICVGKAINKALGGRKGTVFAGRYAERIITNPTQCRHTLAYVLNNARHHAYDEGATYARNRVDPCSSARSFDGWQIEQPRPWGRIPARTDDDDKPVIAAPETWLLRRGWRRGGGLLSPNTIPSLPKGAPALPQW